MRPTRFRAVALAAVLALSPTLAGAELAPVSDPFEIVPSITFPLQVDPSGGAGDLTRSAPVVAAIRGGFAVAWVEETLFADDVMTSAVRGRLVGAGGALGREFAAAVPDGADAPPRVSCPGIAGLGDGFDVGFSRFVPGVGRELWLQRFGSDGIATAPLLEPLASAPFTLHDVPALSANPAGRSVLAWQAAALPATGGVVTSYHALAFDLDGTVRTFDLQLGARAGRYSPLRPAVAVDRAGRFTAAWLAPNPNPGAAAAVWMQSFDAHGAAVASPALVGRAAVDGIAVARLGAASVLAWARRTAAGTVLRVEHLQADGRRVSPTAPLAGPIESFRSPVLAAVPGKGYLLAWLDGSRLRALHLGPDLAPRGSALDVAAASPDLPGVTAHGIGAAVTGTRVLLAWAGALPDGLCPGNAIVGRLLDVRP